MTNLIRSFSVTDYIRLLLVIVGTCAPPPAFLPPLVMTVVQSALGFPSLYTVTCQDGYARIYPGSPRLHPRQQLIARCVCVVVCMCVYVCMCALLCMRVRVRVRVCLHPR